MRITAAGGLEFQNQDFSNIGTIYATQYLANGFNADTGIGMQGSNVMSSKHTAEITERARFDASGNFGIGTSSPDTKLHVHKGASGLSGSPLSDSTLVLENNTHNYLTILSPSNTESALIFGDADSNNVASVGYSHSENRMAFGVNGSERMRINSSGDVLIGQTSQTGYTFAQKLVVGDGDANDGITIQSGSTHQGNLAFNHSDGTTAHGRISYQHSSNYMSFFTNNSERMRIDSVGETTIKRAGSGGSGVLKALNLIHAGTSVNDGAKISLRLLVLLLKVLVYASTGQALIVQVLFNILCWWQYRKNAYSVKW